MKITVIGTGNMGTAIGGVLADGGSAVEHVSHDAVGTAPLTGDFVVLAVQAQRGDALLAGG